MENLSAATTATGPAAWTPAELDAVERADEVGVSTYRADGSVVGPAVRDVTVRLVPGD